MTSQLVIFRVFFSPLPPPPPPKSEKNSRKSTNKKSGLMLALFPPVTANIVYFVICLCTFYIAINMYQDQTASLGAVWSGFH